MFKNQLNLIILKKKMILIKNPIKKILKISKQGQGQGLKDQAHVPILILHLHNAMGKF